MSKKQQKLTARDMIAKLRTRYAAPAWVLLEEVRNQTGYSGPRERYADALALGMYPSRGIDLLGFEVKVSRSDVMAELKNPDKARAIQQYCNRWYLVVSSKKLVSLDEVPATWGVLAPRGSGLSVLKEAPRQKVADGTLPITFVASLLRSAHRQQPAKDELEKARQEGVERGKELQKWEVKRLQDDLRKIRGKVTLFEETSGVTCLAQEPYAWEGRIRGQATTFKALMRADVEQYFQEAGKLARKLEATAASVRSELVKHGALPEKPSLEDPCPHPKRGMRHELYLRRDDTKGEGPEVFCRACGAEGPKEKV